MAAVHPPALLALQKLTVGGDLHIPLLCIRNGSMHLLDLNPRWVGEHRGVELLESDLGLMGGGMSGKPTLSPVPPAS